VRAEGSLVLVRAVRFRTRSEGLSNSWLTLLPKGQRLVGGRLTNGVFRRTLVCLIATLMRRIQKRQ
jgi:hypothetical protein